MSCTRPLAYNADTTSSPIVVTLTDIFDLKELQQIQDSFAVATGVASIITQPDGVPITTPSNFTRLCNDIIRKTGKGCANCYKSDALLGRYNPEGPVLQPCLSGGLWDAGASITVGGHHVGNWLIGQVRNETQDEASMLSYADDIGADRKDFLAALAEVPSMSVDQFRNVANALFLLANQLSDKAYQNLQLKQTIKQREQAELELKASEQRFSELIRYSSDSITILDKNGIQIFVSDAVEKMLGYKPSELLGIPVIEEMLHPDDQEMVSHAFATIINDGMGGAQYRHKHKNGSWVYLEAWGTNQLENPDIRGVVVNVRDITERKQAETSLRESREKYRIMFENLPLGLAFTDTTGRYLEVNRAIEEIFGSSRRNLLGVPPLERGFTVLHQDGTPFQQHELITLRAAREQQLIQGDHLIRRTNGTYCYVSSIAAPLPLPGYGAMLAVMDITERKRAEDALRESESRLQNLFEKMPNGYYRSTPAGRFVDANPAFVKMLGYDSKEELLQVDIPRTVYVEPEERGVYLRANKNSEFLGFEHVEYYRLRGKDGRIIQVEDQARYVKNAQGEVAFHEGICRDIT
ncbi:MAG: PAS domain S-box protein [Proteobacteria bacterium]|nr:PAS domain S-box protein [Pseudomonadota bacterium]